MSEWHTDSFQWSLVSFRAALSYRCSMCQHVSPLRRMSGCGPARGAFEQLWLPNAAAAPAMHQHADDTTSMHPRRRAAGGARGVWPVLKELKALVQAPPVTMPLALTLPRAQLWAPATPGG